MWLVCFEGGWNEFHIAQWLLTLDSVSGWFVHAINVNKAAISSCETCAAAPFSSNMHQPVARRALIKVDGPAKGNQFGFKPAISTKKRGWTEAFKGPPNKSHKEISSFRKQNRWAFLCSTSEENLGRFVARHCK